jgi:YD repeat-containing protein
MSFYSQDWVAKLGIHSSAAGAALVLMLSQGMPASASTLVVIDYSYDDLDRLTMMGRADGPLVDYTYDEVSNITSQTIANSADFDGDLLADFVDDDDDNDLIPDSIELNSNLDPFNGDDAALDLDGDGISNLAEYLLGSDINHKHGDLNADARVDAGDVVLLQAILSDLLAAEPGQRLPGHGDVNLNGRLDVGDLVIIERIYQGF